MHDLPLICKDMHVKVFSERMDSNLRPSPSHASLWKRQTEENIEKDEVTTLIVLYVIE